MEIEKEKILVAEFLGFKVKPDHKYRNKYVWSDTYDTYKTHHYFGCTFDEWNPQSERKWWDEIYQKLAQKKIFSDFIAALNFFCHFFGEILIFFLNNSSSQ